VKLAEFLIDKAAQTCGSQAELARRMGIWPADVTQLKTGARPLSPEIAAELADIAGEDARQAAIDAIIERNKGTRKEGAMRDILGKGLAAGVAVLLAFSYSADSISAMADKTTRISAFTVVYIV
jgi:DNA-binding transcriptional regulator YdaS (Cro superfamily)